jgi:hypothetical protein
MVALENQTAIVSTDQLAGLFEIELRKSIRKRQQMSRFDRRHGHTLRDEKTPISSSVSNLLELPSLPREFSLV